MHVQDTVFKVKRENSNARKVKSLLLGTWDPLVTGGSKDFNHLPDT